MAAHLEQIGPTLQVRRLESGRNSRKFHTAVWDTVGGPKPRVGGFGVVAGYGMWLRITRATGRASPIREGIIEGPAAGTPDPVSGDPRIRTARGETAIKRGEGSDFVGTIGAFPPTPSAALRYWNMARQRYCRRLLRYRNNLRVSADPVAKPAAHTRAESRGSPRTRAAWGERQTLRWREQDSNHRSRVTRPIFQCRLWLVPRQPKSRSERAPTRSVGPFPRLR
jgi:hypothetical protein